MGLLKKPWMIGVIILITALICTGIWYMTTREEKPEFTGPVQASLNFAQDIYHIGDKMTLTLTVLTEPGYTVRYPEITPPESVEIVDKDELKIEKKWGLLRYTFTFNFTTFEPGEYILPEITFPYTTPDGTEEELKVEGATLLVSSLLTNESTDIRGLKPLADVPEDYLIYYLLAGVLLLAVAIIVLWRYLRRRRRSVEAPEEPPLPAHVIAYQRLAHLETSDLLEEGQIDKYFTILSEIIRQYIENRFAVKAREMTTQEFLARALRRLNLTHGQQELLREFLQHADLVKYARHIPAYDQIHRGFMTVRNFVDETKIVEEEGGEDVV